MALQLSSLSASSLRSQNSVPCFSCSGSSSGSTSSSSSRWCLSGSKNVNLQASGGVGRGRSGVAAKCGVDTTGVYTVGKVTEVDKDTFWPIVNSAPDKTVVLDMYTQWCGPCKVMAPKFQELAEKYLDVVFLKLDCNQENKSLAKELGLRVVPTFKILKEGAIVKEVKGAKFDDLVLAIDTVRSG
ncbi:thioredoxin F-type, chloroplastic-like [Rhodamnia argentea]|uniref:Thioredoxin F-type, chloroplastic-like n=1 Tax=Rhodamnia argentea TaxID=178133 RepID=A0A8B8P446_9MYRT|nr:thioredoxin F-type, chloroplastic-like [Rhodamnia argentea]